ncbi:MAG TPA: hypothetical protein VG675_19075 [Bryobacteraceae bacterium]|nr:hypothetical protein [Bryobacteraceae bacterium]
MWMRAARCGTLLLFIPLMCIAAPRPADWVPARWPWQGAKSLELLTSSPVNCLLLQSYSPEFLSAAAARSIVTLAVLSPGGDPAAAARRALAAGVNGIVLDGDFPQGTPGAVRAAAGSAPVIELTARNRMPLGSNAAILGTYQGVWPGISLQDNGTTKAGPTGSVWIDTNTGFIRAVRAWGDAALWIGNQPPPHTTVTAERYLQVIGDAAMSGARWVLAFDSTFAAALQKRDAAALHTWQRMGGLLRYYEAHREWRQMRPYGKLALVQDPAKGGLLSGGILDMIAVKHTPVRPVPQQHLTAAALANATMAVDVDADALTPAQKEILRNFARSGGTLLTGPPGWKDQIPQGEKITLDQAELDHLNEIWRDVNAMIGRHNLGVRLFNVASMLSNFLVSADGKTAVVQLVNYSDYPVENVAVHFLGNYKHATLTTPEGVEKPLEIYETDDGGGVDIDNVAVCATVKLEQ